jgi:hypothetical protein
LEWHRLWQRRVLRARLVWFQPELLWQVDAAQAAKRLRQS